MGIWFDRGTKYTTVFLKMNPLPVETCGRHQKVKIEMLI
jgi:hypothetical protein